MILQILATEFHAHTTNLKVAKYILTMNMFGTCYRMPKKFNYKN